MKYIYTNELLVDHPVLKIVSQPPEKCIISGQETQPGGIMMVLGTFGPIIWYARVRDGSWTLLWRIIVHLTKLTILLRTYIVASYCGFDHDLLTDSFLNPGMKFRDWKTMSALSTCP